MNDQKYGNATSHLESIEPTTNNIKIPESFHKEFTYTRNVETHFFMTSTHLVRAEVKKFLIGWLSISGLGGSIVGMLERAVIIYFRDPSLGTEMVVFHSIIFTTCGLVCVLSLIGTVLNRDSMSLEKLIEKISDSSKKS